MEMLGNSGLTIALVATVFSSFICPAAYGSGIETMDALHLIEYNGYPAEEFPVITSDGYILRIQRIPYGRGQSAPAAGAAPRPVIFLQHGLECSSTNWITNLPNESAAFIFADAGFDVWLGNFRGNTYGKAHINLSPSDTKFWQFTWDEMAKYDLPAMIDYVLDKTGHTSLYYAGHSEGTLTAFAQFSSDQYFAKKIKKFFALAPIVTIKHIKGALAYMAPFTTELEFFLNLVGVNQFLPNDWLMKELGHYVCGYGPTNPICDDILFLVAGPNSNQLNDTRMPVYIGHTPAGTSTNNIVHFGQMVNSGKFQKYSYGDIGNLRHYGHLSAPEYELKNCKVRTHLFCGDLDWLGDLQDIEDSIIGVLPDYEYHLCQGFNHLDFIWGMKAAPQVYQKILNIIQAEDGLILNNVNNGDIAH